MATSDTDAFGSERAEGYKWHDANLRFDLRLDKGKNILVQARADLTVRDQHSESEDSSEECNIAPSGLGPREELGSREVHLHKTFRHHTDVPHLELISVFRDRRL